MAMLGMGGGTHWASEEITVAGRDITDLTLVLKPSLTITGKVIYEASTLKAPEDMTTVRLAVTCSEQRTDLGSHHDAAVNAWRIVGDRGRRRNVCRQRLCRRASTGS